MARFCYIPDGIWGNAMLVIFSQYFIAMRLVFLEPATVGNVV
jgi:hypothetical protein